METILFYLLRVSIAAGILFICYKLFLSRNTFHHINRVVLLCIFAASFVLPILTVRLSEIQLFEREIPMQIITQNFVQTVTPSEFEVSTPVFANINSENEIAWQLIFLWVYVIGIAVCVLRYGLSLIQITQIIRKSRKVKYDDNTVIYISAKEISPFSWTNKVILSETDYNENKVDIILHEKSHIQHKHSIDLFLSYLYCIIYWFNPFAWLLRNELRNVHEFQADANVVKGKADVKEYQLLLIRQCVGEQKFSIANNFEYKNLQKRVQMIMKKQSSSHIKYLYLSLIVAAFASVAIISCTKVNDGKHSKNQITGHIRGYFDNSNLNGRMLINAIVNTPDILRDSKGRIIKSRAPKDSTLAEFKVLNGKFDYNYRLYSDDELKLIFVDNDNIHWKIGFINPYSESGKFIISFLMLNDKSDVNIRVLTQTVSQIQLDEYDNTKYKKVEAEITGSDATTTLFKKIAKNSQNNINRNIKSGHVTGRITRIPRKLMDKVKISNLNSNKVVYSDKNGHYKIDANKDDILNISLKGYKTVDLFVKSVNADNTLMMKKSNGNDDENIKLGQTFTITGDVKDAADFSPIEGAAVWIKGTNAKTFTDKDGKYTIEAKYRDIVNISKKGYKTTGDFFVRSIENVTSYFQK